jgi:hypothetical protein
MTSKDLVVRHLSESLTQDPRLKVEVEQNSRGINITVSYRGDDEDEVVGTTLRVLRRLRREINDE